jgi:hypothetical protein
MINTTAGFQKHLKLEQSVQAEICQSARPIVKINKVAYQIRKRLKTKG